MSQISILNETFKGIEKKIQSELYAHKSIYELQSYNSVNFKVNILDPLIKGFFDEIDQFTIDEFLNNKLINLIQKIESFRENNLKKERNTAMELYQISHINYLISKLTDKQLLILKFLEDSNNIVDSNNGLTKLSKKETALLMLYLQEKGAILPYNNLKDTRLSELFSGLTPYSSEQLRKLISGDSRRFKNEISTNRSNFESLKLLLEGIITQINKDLDSFN